MEVAAFTVAPGARPQCTAVRAAAPEMWLVPTAATVGVVGTVIATKKALKLIPKKESADVTAFRSSLGGMESLSGLSELKLEREEVEGRTAGPWKEMIKNDGRIWYYNTETKSQTWIKPEEIQKLDDVKAAAEAANEARGC